MKSDRISRREMLLSSGTILSLSPWSSFEHFSLHNPRHKKLAVHGGEPIRTKSWPEWPVWNREAEEDIIKMLRSGKWWRGNGDYVEEFEKQYAQLLGARRCLATSSGSGALLVALHVMGVDAGDEVLVSPFTFVASYNVILQHKALPVFVDTDPETFTLNPDKIKERITDRTSAIMPVHIYGLPANMNKINELARTHQLKVVEDACQAWLAEYGEKKAGTLGDLGCFSFQNSKNLPAGEGGAIVGNNDEVMDQCYSFHNCGRPFGSVKGKTPIPTRGSNRRMQQFQAIMLMSQMKRIKTDADQRLKNAKYLDQRLKEIPGIIPYQLAEGATRSAYHLYPFRFKKEFFGDISKEKFLSALHAEGIPCSPGYGPQNKYEIIEEALNSKGFKRLFSEQRLKQYREENVLPGNDQLCEEAVTLYQSLLLAERSDMDDIVNAIHKIYKLKDQLKG